MNKKIAFMSLAIAVAMPAAAVTASEQAATNSTTSTTVPTQKRMDGQNFAQNKELRDQNQELKNQNQDQRSQIKDQRGQNIEDRCKNTESKIGERLTKFQESRMNFTKAFENMQARLQRLVDRLSTTQGIDLTNLKADIATLSTMTATAKTNQEEVLATMQDLQTAAPTSCGTSKGEFMGKLGGARTLALTAQKSRLDIRTFFQTKIKPDLLAIRKQLETQKETTAAAPEDNTIKTEKVETEKTL